MDPVTALGIAAAAVQFAAVAVKGIKGGIGLLMRLDKTPGELKDLLDDVKQSIDRAAQWDTLRLTRQLSNEQADALRGAANDAEQAMKDLQATLNSIFPDQNGRAPSVTRRIWRSIISVKKEYEIKAKLERIKRLNDAVTHQLQLCIVDMEMQHREVSDRTLTAAERTCLHVDQLNSRLEPTMDQLANLQQQTCIEVTTQKTLAISIQNSMNSNSEELRAIKAMLSQFILSQSRLPGSEQTVIEQPPEGDLTRQIGREEQRPIPPSPASQVPMEVPVYRENAVYIFSPLPRPCKCRTRLLRSTNRGTWIFFGYEESRTHENSCPLSGSAKHVRIARWGFKFQNKIVELAFGVTIQGWNIHLSPSLKTVVTVRRSESAIFRLFDELPGRCGIELADSFYIAMATISPSYSAIKGVDVEIIRRELKRVYQYLIKPTGSGVCSLTDRDENDRTLFHEIISLVISVAAIYADLSDEIDSLLQLGEYLDVDHNAFANAIERRSDGVGAPSPSLFHFGRDSIANLARTCVSNCCHLQGDYSYLRRLFSFYAPSLENPISELFTQYHRSNEHTKTSIIDALRRDPWALAYLFTGDLALAVLSRNLERLKEVLVTADLDADAFSFLQVNVLDLAIGWPEGLRLLSTVWTHGIARTIALALYLENEESLKTLLSFPVALFMDSDETLFVINTMISSNTRSVLIEELRRRRDELADVARNCLSVADQAYFGLRERKVLDTNAYPVYNLLTDGSNPVPSHLNPGTNVSVYNIIATLHDHLDSKSTSLMVFECLYELFLVGFLDTDETNMVEFSLSPLETIYNTPTTKNFHILVNLSIWFLRMGASPALIGERNILLGIAQKFHCRTLDSDSELIQLKILTQYATSLFSPLESDQCTCYCSSSGCLPLHHLNRESNECIYHKSQHIFSWVQLCGLREDEARLYLEEAVRAELFNALGMGHTCCIALFMSDSEKREIRDEDLEMQSQLELLMTAYRRSRSSPLPPGRYGWVVECNSRCPKCLSSEKMGAEHTLPDFWNWWWYKVAQILPDVGASLVDQSTDDEGVDDTHVVGLEEGEYEDMNFTEVIRRHFAEYLDPGHWSPDQLCTTNSDSEAMQQTKEFVPRKRTDLLMEVLGPYEAKLSDEQRLFIENFANSDRNASKSAGEGTDNE
ncbi:hypothetical protein MGYG_08048 [Nannizzia gypsea CBS 118893]|uniref:Fungal N-terminal domain-containing protein n=1 Tax=Arthroderma gypseum (strain ATCC MYA-4604 / CBS 118893) TaxID=535722 RepID=E4V4W9_ARTGP|nr:hypothetical protein MGYG_08048 [Nannizzia gypsea CBS 118893]EFR05043.1 hypothetical protein MGYG_08048 [Nannizzia gypsea CBS 118893]